jgi:hypothetical protein
MVALDSDHQKLSEQLAALTPEQLAALPPDVFQACSSPLP